MKRFFVFFILIFAILGIYGAISNLSSRTFIKNPGQKSNYSENDSDFELIDSLRATFRNEPPVFSPFELFFGKADTEGVDDLIKSAVSEADTSGIKIAIYFRDLGSQHYYAHQETLRFTSASLYKLWVMGAAFVALESQELNLTDQIGADVNLIRSVLNTSYSSPDGKPYVSDTLENALNKMITVSDNFSAYLTWYTLGIGKPMDFVTNIGLKNTDLGDGVNLPATTAADVGFFLENLYLGNIVSSESSGAMIELLKKQELNHKLARYIPDNIDIAHKTGELDKFSHDAAIFYTQKGDYILVVLTESNYPDTANELMAKMSKEIYERYYKL